MRHEKILYKQNLFLVMIGYIAYKSIGRFREFFIPDTTTKLKVSKPSTHTRLYF